MLALLFGVDVTLLVETRVDTRKLSELGAPKREQQLGVSFLKNTRLKVL